MRKKLSRNAPCPCGSGSKLKACCLETVNWESAFSAGPSSVIRLLSARGKNLAFLESACQELGVSLSDRELDWPTVKERMTPERVHTIHDSIRQLWPDASDLNRILTSCKPSVTGLYIGEMEPSSILSSVLRNSLYVERILVPDPFVYPGSVNRQFDPLAHPEIYITQSLKSLWTWLHLAPWISAGIVAFIRLPDDFDWALRSSSLARDTARANDPELKAILEQEAARSHIESPIMRDMMKFHLLLTPDDELVELLSKSSEMHGLTKSQILVAIEEMRRSHPYYVPFSQLPQASTNPRRPVSQLQIGSTGGSYDVARATCNAAGSFLLTDVEFKWAVIKKERETEKVDDSGWEPFAKALQDCTLPVLGNISLAAALELRATDRLSEMRGFLRKVWRQAVSAQPYGKENAENLASELGELIMRAREEWNEIDHELIKWFGPTALAGLSAAAAVSPQFLAASCVAGAVELGSSALKHRAIEKSPAGFFLRRLRKKT